MSTSSDPAAHAALPADGSGSYPSSSVAPQGGELHAELARAAHDVNNALNTVLVASHLLQLSAADPDAVRRHADRIAQAARQGVAAAARTRSLLRASGAAATSSESQP